MFSGVETLQRELACSICLEYFQDPVSIQCGHNFCRACISQCWEGSVRNFSCPQCRKTARKRNFRPNRELARVIEIAKGLSFQAAKGLGRCEKHQEALKLFCEDDQTPICVVCRESQAHRAHTVVPIEEAGLDYKVRKLWLGLERGWKAPGTVARSVSLYVPFPELDCGSDSLPLNVTLDPDTAHPELTVSEDRRSVRWGDTRRRVPDNPKRFDAEPCVLGCEGFTSGRHYWEVEVGDGGYWAMGVARESVRRKEEISHSHEAGIWILCQCVDEYWAQTSPLTTLYLSWDPRRIGVLLDYEVGRVSFFDADNEKPIFTFPPASFGGERVHPWFHLCGEDMQLQLCP
uniref:Uncharacterized protein n=1 Tax=Chrysemys picta bellii TaxID=8478 RepID=A0A8C3I6T6_CHRPI